MERKGYLLRVTRHAQRRAKERFQLKSNREALVFIKKAFNRHKVLDAGRRRTLERKRVNKNVKGVYFYLSVLDEALLITKIQGKYSTVLTVLNVKDCSVCYTKQETKERKRYKRKVRNNGRSREPE